MKTVHPIQFNGLFVVGVLITLFTTAFCSFDHIKGSGHIVSKDFEIEHFKAIEISGYFDVELNQTGKESLQIETDDNLMQYVEAKVVDETLQVRIKDHIEIGHSKKLKIHLGFADLQKIEVSGAATLHSLSAVREKEMKIEISGAADLNMDFFTESLRIEESGAGNFKLGGRTANLSVEISGAGNVDAYQLEAKDSKIEISGAGSAAIRTSNTLDVSISGVGSVKYKGNPTITKEITAIGSLKNDN